VLDYFVTVAQPKHQTLVSLQSKWIASVLLMGKVKWYNYSGKQFGSFQSKHAGTIY
jgi:hypothetical protein